MLLLLYYRVNCGFVGNVSAEMLANTLAAKAQESGSTDDVSIICAKLNV